MKTITILACALMLMGAPAGAQRTGGGAVIDSPDGGGDPLEGLDHYLRGSLDAWSGVGLAVTIVKDGRVVFERGYGLRSLGDPDPVDEHTLFAIGSTTKAVTAVALGMLVDEGKVRWDDRVTRHLPWFQLRDPWATRELTVRDLLTHRAGLPNADYLWYEQNADTRDILERLRLVEPAYSMRSGFVYQNLMYAAAGEVVAAAAEIPWSAFIRERIFGPLGMGRSVTSLADALRQDNAAAPHEEVAGRVVVIENAAVDPVAAAGSVWSTAHDMGKWVAFLLRGCLTESGVALLHSETCDELFTPQAMVDPAAFYPTRRLTHPHWITYGLGWFQQDYEGRKVDFHTGSIDGMVALAGLLRDENLGVYILGNLDHLELRHAIMLRVFDLYDGEAPRDWSAELLALYGELTARNDSARAEAEASRVHGTSPTLPLARYAGRYSDPLFGTVIVTEDPGGLRIAYVASKASSSTGATTPSAPAGRPPGGVLQR